MTSTGRPAILLLDPRWAQDGSFSQLEGVGVEIAEQLVAATIDAATEDDCASQQFKTAGRAAAVFTWMCSVNRFLSPSLFPPSGG